jgi:4-amino-4-deoxy-L-arabinose transferase-like glycosyltransferase
VHLSTPLPLLPAVLILATWLGLYASLRATGRSTLESMSIASVGWGACHWFLAELLSRTGHLTPGGAVVGWSIASLVTLLTAWALWRRSARELTSESEDTSQKQPLSTTDRVVIALLVVLVGAIGVVGLATPIMSWDAQHYHIPRILYWVQNGSVEHYPTANARQLFMGPWSAFVQLHVYLLAGSDRLAHLLQWLCMVGSVVLGAGVARQLGGRRAAALTAAALIATLPMGILLASTALVDYVAAFWLLVLVFLGLRTLSLDRIGWLDRLALGGALGLAVLTKGTAVPIAAPFVAVWIGARLRRSLGTTWQTVALASLVALALNTNQFRRNLAVFDHFSGPEDHRRLVLNESYDPRFLVSNLVRHTLAHIGTADPDQAGLQLAFSDSVHRLIGVVDGDPRNSLAGQTLHIEPFRRVDYLAGNPVHLLLYLACGVWLIITRSRHATVRLLLYGTCLLGAAVLFVVLFKYQHTVSRLHLPLFVLAAPWCAKIVANHWPKKWALTITLFFLLTSVPWVFFAERRPLFGSQSVLRLPREDLLYKDNGTYRLPARGIAREVHRRELPVLGLLTHGSSLEYFLWHELSQYDPMPTIVNLVPPPGLAPKPDIEPKIKRPPRYVAWLRPPKEAPVSVQLHGRSYHRRRHWRWGPESLYKKNKKQQRSR